MNYINRRLRFTTVHVHATKEMNVHIRRLLLTLAATMAVALGVTVPAIGERFPAPGAPGQPVISGDLTGANSHGVIHCQALGELLRDPNLPPGSAPGNIVVNPQGTQFAGPPNGLCEEFYGIFTGTGS